MSYSILYAKIAQQTWVKFGMRVAYPGSTQATFDPKKSVPAG